MAARNAVRGWSKELKVTAAQTEWMEGADMDVARHLPHVHVGESGRVALELPPRSVTTLTTSAD